MRLIVNNSDLISFERIINFPPRGVGKTSVKKIIDYANDKSITVFDALKNLDEIKIGVKQKKSLQFFQKLINEASKNTHNYDILILVKELVKSIGLKEYYTDQGTEDAYDRWANVNELINSIEDYSNKFPDLKLIDFLEEVSLLSDIDRWNDQTDAVTLMTLHSAKGLEFPNVFIAGVEEGLFPLYSSIDDVEQLEEERRLFYVGVTRAEKKILLFYSNSRRRFSGERVPTIKSRFIDEIPDKYLNFEKKSFIENKVQHSPYIEKNTSETFIEGDRVLHKVFGRGRVLNVQGVGGEAKVTISFSGNQIKKFILKYANLVRL